MSETVGQELRPAAFFDRDGVLNRDVGYPHRVQDLDLIPGAATAVRICNDAGYLVFIVSNQSGVARGLFDEEAVRLFNRALIGEIAAQGGRIDDVRYCPHHPEGTVSAYRGECECRKPRAGMLLDLMSTWRVDAARSFFVGDERTDLEAAQAAGVVGILYDGVGPLDRLIGPLLNKN